MPDRNSTGESPPAALPPDTPPDRREPRYSRGQTGIDFLIGMTVFLLTVGFVFGFVPGILDPFDDDLGTASVADRATHRLADQLLANQTRPGELNATCTFAFFAGTTDPSCPSDGSVALAEQVGVESTYHLNVTLKRDVDADGSLETLCRAGTAVDACPGDGLRLEAGPSVATEDATVSTRRTVYVDGKDATLVVGVW